MITAGIDPGKKGGLVLLGSSGLPVLVERVPLIKTKVNNKVREVIDYGNMFRVWKQCMEHLDHVFIEQVTGSLGKGAQSGSFNFGYSAGFIYGIVSAAGVPHTFITPQKWKKIMGLPPGSDKGASIRRAIQLFPDSAAEFARKTVDEGVAEAALIGKAGRHILGAN